MPYAKKTTKKFAKKATGRKRRTPRQVKPQIQRTMISLGQGFPKKLVMNHRYCEVMPCTILLGTMYHLNWSANGMYDPNLQVGGHQPMYFDQMSALYNHYTVIGSKITVKVVHASAANVGARAALYINDDITVVPSFLDAIREKNPSSSKVIPPAVGAPTTIFSLNWSAKKTFGGSILGNDELRGNALANPVEQSVYTFSIQPLDITSSQIYQVEFLIEYTAVWTELKDLISS